MLEQTEKILLGTSLANAYHREKLLLGSKAHMFQEGPSRKLYEWIRYQVRNGASVSVAQAKQNVDSAYVNECFLAAAPQRFKGALSEFRNQFIQRESLKLSALYQANIVSIGPDMAMQELSKAYDLLAQELELSTLKSVGDIHQAAFDKAKQKHDQKVKYLGLDIGFETFMEKADGALPGRVYVVAAQSGTGKTLVINNITETLERQGVRTATVSIEMTGDSISYRQASQVVGATMFDIKKGNLSEEQWAVYANWVKSKQNVKSYINDDSHKFVEDLWEFFRQIKRKGVKVVFIDYFQLLSTRKRTKNPEERFTEISKEITSMAKEFDLTVFVIAQLSKAGSNRTSGIPTIEDIRYSSQLTNDAYMIILLWRPGRHGVTTDDEGVPFKDGTLRFIIGKHRDGPLFGFDVAPEFEGSMKLVEVPRITPF